MSKKYDEALKSKIIRLHLEEGRTQKSLTAEYGLGAGTISYWVKKYREECNDNEEKQEEYDIYKENARLRGELAEAKKEVLFLKKAAAFFAKEIE